MYYRISLLLLFVVFSCRTAAAQTRGTLSLGGDIYEYMLDDRGDTVILATIGDVSVSSVRNFKNPEDYSKYRKYRRYAFMVYPYAAEAIRIFRELEQTTSTMREGERRRHIRRLQNELKENFEDPLRNLTRTQGMILVEMIERELHTPLYDLIKGLRGTFNATYWNTMGSFYGYKIKEGYVRGQDPILDIVLDDINLSYDHTLPKDH